ncbi:NAD-dependent epimerase/dehydratase family protein, partial [Staphylococcus aureus]
MRSVTSRISCCNGNSFPKISMSRTGPIHAPFLHRRIPRTILLGDDNVMAAIILVTGATGKLGQRVVSRLLQRQAEVRVLTRRREDAHKL